jgi:hypothetical protein
MLISARRAIAWLAGMLFVMTTVSRRSTCVAEMDPTRSETASRWLRSITSLLLLLCLNAVGQTLPPEGSPATGTIEGVPFRVPREYLFFGVNYSGQNWLDPTSGLPEPGKSRSIDFFDMLLSRDLLPYADVIMRERWLQQGRHIPLGGATKEVVVMVEKWTQAATDKQAHATAIRKLVESRTRPRGGTSHFQRTWQSEARLVRWSERDPAAGRTRQKDVYHDQEYTVFIECGYAAPEAPNAFESCRQVMFVEGLPVQVTARFNRDFLPAWKPLHERIGTLVNSFVVR